MKTNSNKLALRALAAVGTCAATLSAPTVALASEEGGMGLLIPKVAEFIPACVAFVIIWIVLAKFAWPTVVKTMEDRENKIKGDLEGAEQAKADAEKERDEYAARIADAQRQADEIIAQAKKDGEAQRAQIIAQAQKDAASIVAKSHDAISSERHKAMVELSGSVVDLSVEIAGKIIGNDLGADEQRKLAAKYLAEVSVSDGE